MYTDIYIYKLSYKFKGIALIQMLAKLFEHSTRVVCNMCICAVQSNKFELYILLAIRCEHTVVYIK